MADDAGRNSPRKDSGRAEVSPTECALARNQLQPESSREVIGCCKGKSKETPEHKRVRKSGERPLTDDFRLQENIPNEITNPRRQWS